MGKIVSMILGVVCVVVGLYLLIRWRIWFIRGLQATVPAMLVCGGTIALLAGISEMKDTLKEKKEKK